ncbi:MAG: aminotransferase class V-fold PLP-dependent enzyme [Planctomycetes bacterium]|nr:aminotransferase class V-fold PLP-dependent enzyme [Planctomycetota bacterium]
MLTKESRRADFPSLDEMVYLNTAAEGIPPRCVVAAIEQYAQDKLLGMDGRVLHQWQWNGVRQGAAGLLGLSPDEIGVCSCSSEAFNLAALALQFRPGDEVVINDLDYPAGVTPWLQPACPAQVRLWKSREGALRVEDLSPLLGSATRLVTLSLVSFFNGFKADLREVVETVHARCRALIAVDVTQALGRVPLDLQGIDLIVSSTHKWILGSHGGGLVGVPAARAADLTVPAGGWFNLDNAFENDRFERVVTKPGAASFSVGMPNYPAAYAVNAALRYISDTGVAAIHEHAQPLVHACMAGLKRLPVDMLTPDDPHALAGIIAFRHPKAGDIHRHLHERRIHVMYHAGRLRVAIHGYNTADDVDRFLAALKEATSHV